MILHCIYVYVLYPFICQCTFRLLPCSGYFKQWCNEYWMHVSFWTMFFSRYMPMSGIAGLFGSSSFSFLRNLHTLPILAVSIYIPNKIHSWWTCVWVNSGSWWWTRRPGVLQFTGSQRVGRDWVTELNWTQENLQIHCNPYQITNGTFHRSRSKNLKICMETQKTLNS